MQHLRASLLLGFPIVGSQLAQHLIQMTDTIMLGWYSIDALAAAVLATTMWFLLFVAGSGFATAVMPMVAAAAASGNHAEVRRSTRMALWLTVFFCVLVMPIMLASGPILGALGQDPTIASMAASYLIIAGWSIFPALGTMVLRSYLSALERAHVVLWITLIAVVLNAAVNYALIFGNWGAPELGLRGAAIATVFTNFFSFGTLAIYAAVATREHALFQRLWRPDWECFARVYHLGWPIGASFLAEVSLFSIAAIFMGWIGTLELAAHGIALQIASTTFLVHSALANTATIRAGAAFGRHDEVNLRRGGLVICGVSAVVVLVAMAAFIFIPETLIGLFVDPTDPLRPQIIAIGATLMLVAAVFQLADAGQVMAQGLLRGVQDTKIPMVIALISYWLVATPASYIFGFVFDFGGVGVWFGLVIGLSFAWVMLTYRFWARSVRIGNATAPA